ncbi:hypothetical protein HA51_09050 [Pantoea rwandensis]|uniref:Uncharacterized protein n=1 Tax=Pantoea rwandensis TaxID=1076550 RepID=A0A1X1D048_9GAMM|nr:hypothetical protein HA51_09050 [Pantoea rwandensis]
MLLDYKSLDATTFPLLPARESAGRLAKMIVRKLTELYWDRVVSFTAFLSITWLILNKSPFSCAGGFKIQGKVRSACVDSVAKLLMRGAS